MLLVKNRERERERERGWREGGGGGGGWGGVESKRFLLIGQNLLSLIRVIC